jgi:hypothetical protein
MNELIAVSKGEDYLEVHPTTLAGHKAVGWKECAKRETAMEATSPTRADLDDALGRLPGDYKDADFVVNGMRRHFGTLFTEADEARVRDLVKAPPASKPSDGLTVEKIKEALAAKKIPVPDGVTLKADLAKLLDEAT